RLLCIEPGDHPELIQGPVNAVTELRFAIKCVLKEPDLHRILRVAIAATSCGNIVSVLSVTSRRLVYRHKRDIRIRNVRVVIFELLGKPGPGAYSPDTRIKCLRRAE